MSCNVLKTLIFVITFLFCVKKNASSNLELRNSLKKEDGSIWPASTEMSVKHSTRKKDETKKRFLSKVEIPKFNVYTVNGEASAISRFRTPEELPRQNRAVSIMKPN